MAYTKIHAIKATVDKAIDYICNPDKTDGFPKVGRYFQREKSENSP